MAYAAWSVVYGEQPTASKWNILGTNDASFNDGTGIANNAIKTAHITDANVTMPKITNPYKAMAHLSADQSIADVATTLIAFDTEDYDPNGNFNNSAGNYKYVAPVTGYYLVTCNVTIFDTTGKLLSASLYTYKDATQIGIANTETYPGLITADGFAVGYTQVVYLVAGEAITFKAYADTSDSGTAAVQGGATRGHCSFHLLSI